ncbi:MAG: FG-GAP repeat protein [Polyangiales bacterium]
MSPTKTFACLFLTLPVGCNWSALDEYADTAPIRVRAAPTKYRGERFGEVLASYRTDLAAGYASRYATSAGGGSPVVIDRAFDDGALRETAVQRCKHAGECGDGFDVGEALIAFDTWGAGEQPPRHGCVFAPGNGTAPATVGVVVCESHDVPQRFDLRLDALLARDDARADAPRGADAKLQFSGFGLPPGHPLGVVVFGAHAVNLRSGERARGGLYAQPDLTREGAEPVAPAPRPLTLRDARGAAFALGGDAGDLGRQVVGAVGASGELRVAIAQPSRQRVLVASFDAARPDGLTVRACIASPDPALRGFGERAAFGDVDGDGQPELFVGVDPVAGIEPGREALFAYAGVGFPGASAALPTGAREASVTPAASASCPPWLTPPVSIACRDADGIGCAGAAFGASLATGDLDADGRAELLVGAPRARVRGVEGAGAAWLIPGAQAGLALDAMRAVTPAPREAAHFGAAVATVRSAGRDEPVIGAPGAARVYLFLCSPLERGFGASTPCLPE